MTVTRHFRKTSARNRLRLSSIHELNEIIVVESEAPFPPIVRPRSQAGCDSGQKSPPTDPDHPAADGLFQPAYPRFGQRRFAQLPPASSDPMPVRLADWQQPPVVARARLWVGMRARAARPANRRWVFALASATRESAAPVMPPGLQPGGSSQARCRRVAKSAWNPRPNGAWPERWSRHAHRSVRGRRAARLLAWAQHSASLARRRRVCRRVSDLGRSTPEHPAPACAAPEELRVRDSTREHWLRARRAAAKAAPVRSPERFRRVGRRRTRRSQVRRPAGSRAARSESRRAIARIPSSAAGP